MLDAEETIKQTTRNLGWRWTLFYEIDRWTVVLQTYALAADGSYHRYPDGHGDTIPAAVLDAIAQAGNVR